MTADTGEFLTVTGEFLRAEPARNSVMLTVTADLEAAGPWAGDEGMLFGWRRAAGGPPTAAFMHTPGYPAMLSGMSETAAAELARDLTGAGHRVPGWFAEFALEIGEGAEHDHHADVDRRLGYGGITFWEAGGAPVSVAGLTRAVGGWHGSGPVYTPPELRGRGYAAGATAAVSQAALDAGVREVVLYTDLANPVSNALYERLGYRAVEDRVLLSFEPPVTLHP